MPYTAACCVADYTSQLPTAQRGDVVECCCLTLQYPLIDIWVNSMKQIWSDIPGLSAIPGY